MITNTQPNPSATFSHAHMTEIVNQALGQGFTGLGRITYLLGQELKLLIQQGEVREILSIDKNQRSHLSGEALATYCEPSRMGHLSLLKTPGRFLVFERACFDSRPVETRRAVSNSELEKLFLSLRNQESATLVALSWLRAQAYVLVPGGNLPLMRAVFLCGDYLDEDDSALSVMAYWDEPRCDLSLFRAGVQTDAWIALHLNILFEYLCSHLLTQYGYMTGRVMVNSMVRNLAYVAAQFHCELTATSAQLQEQTLFTSLDANIAAYQGLVGYLEKQMETVIGSNFVKVVKKQAVEPLNTFYANLARYYGLVS